MNGKDAKFLFELYLDKLRYYQKLQVSLASIVDPIITLKPTNQSSYHFVPTESSISEQLKHWPKNTPIFLPLPLWVEPQKGIIEFNDEKWEFFFHGSQGLTFTNIHTDQDISIEYTTNGDLGITKWTTQLFLESSKSEDPNFRKLVSQHSRLFEELVKQGYLMKIPPKNLFVEEVFIFVLDI